MENKEKNLLEEISKLIHEEWIEWAKSVEDEVSAERKARWNNSCYCSYEELSEEMKDKDRVYAQKVLDKLKQNNLL